MYQREFDQRLKQALPKAVLLYGENDYLVDHYVDYYIKKLNAKESMLSLTMMSGTLTKRRTFYLKPLFLGEQTL